MVIGRILLKLTLSIAYTIAITESTKLIYKILDREMP